MQQISKNIFENIRIKNLVCRLNVCDPDWGETDCVYGYHKFYYFLDGEGTIIIQGDEYHPKPGELFMIPANTKHTYFHNREKPIYKYWCHFDLTLNECHKLKYLKNKIKCIPPKDITVAIFDRFLNLDISNNPLDALTEKAALLELLKMFFEYSDNNIEYNSNSNSEINISNVNTVNNVNTLNNVNSIRNTLFEVSDDFANQVNDYIHKNIRSAITLHQLADKFHLHPNYFIQYFKKHFSISPIEYVCTLRLSIAAQQLSSDTHKSVAQIAYEVGFNDYRYFSRLFKKKYGLTPSAYRDI